MAKKRYCRPTPQVWYWAVCKISQFQSTRRIGSLRPARGNTAYAATREQREAACLATYCLKGVAVQRGKSFGNQSAWELWDHEYCHFLMNSGPEESASLVGMG